MLITCTAVARSMAKKVILRRIPQLNKKGYLTIKGFQSSHSMHQRALRYNSNTIVTYPKTSKTTICIGQHMNLYKKHYNMVARLFLCTTGYQNKLLYN